jgi:hypothetical protein
VIARPFRSGTLTPGRQVLRNRIGEPNFPGLNHVGEQERGERFGNRADLETAVGVHWTPVTLAEMPVGNHTTALWSDQADDDAKTILLAGQDVNPFRENPANVSIGRQTAWVRSLVRPSPGMARDQEREQCRDRHGGSKHRRS